MDAQYRRGHARVNGLPHPAGRLGVAVCGGERRVAVALLSAEIYSSLSDSLRFRSVVSAPGASLFLYEFRVPVETEI